MQCERLASGSYVLGAGAELAGSDLDAGRGTFGRVLESDRRTDGQTTALHCTQHKGESRFIRRDNELLFIILHLIPSVSLPDIVTRILWLHLVICDLIESLKEQEGEKERE